MIPIGAGTNEWPVRLDLCILKTSGTSDPTSEGDMSGGLCFQFMYFLFMGELACFVSRQRRSIDRV